MHSTVFGFARGFAYPFRAGHLLISNPKLLIYVAVPFLINLVIFSLAVWFGIDRFDTLLASLTPDTSAWWWPLVKYLLWLVAVLLTALAVFFLFAIVGNLVASPFNDILSAKVEKLLTGTLPETPGRGFIRDSLHTLLDEVLKIAVFIGGLLLLLLLMLLPAVGPLIYSLLSMIWTALFLVVDYTSFIFSRRQLSFRDQRLFLRQRRLAALGFGLGSLCLLAIPLLQFFTIPLGVIGAVQFWNDQVKLDAGGKDVA